MKTKKILMILLILLLSAACNLAGPSAAPTPTNPAGAAFEATNAQAPTAEGLPTAPTAPPAANGVDCLNGVWVLDPASFPPYFSSLVTESMDLTSFNGSNTITFEGSQVTSVWNESSLSAVARTADNTAIDLTFSGTTQSAYTLNGNIMTLGETSGTLNTHFSIGGMDMGPWTDDPGLFGTSGTNVMVECQAGALIYTPIVPERNVVGLRYVRP